MSWVKTKSDRVLVLAATRAFACAAPAESTATDSVAQVALAGTSVDDLLSAAHAVHAPIADTRRLSVVVSDVWLSSAELPWASALLSDGEAPLYISMHMELLGVSPGEANVAVDDAPFGQPRLVTGIAVALLEGINRMARDATPQLSVIRPQSAVIHEAVQRQLSVADYAFAVLEAGAVTIAVVRNRRIQQIATQHLHDNAEREVEQCWRRMQLRDAGLADLEFLRVIDLSGQGHSFRSDKVRPLQMNVAGQAAADRALLEIAARAAPAAALAWQGGPRRGLYGARLGAICASVALLLVAAWCVLVERHGVLSAQVELEQMSQRRLADEPQPLSRAETERLASLQEQLAALQMPLDELLIAIRPPDDVRAALLGIDMSNARARATSATVRLTAEAASSEDMAKYVSHLARTAPFTAAQLTRHETAAAAKGVYRFTVEASWTP